MEPLTTHVALDVEKVWIQWLLASAEAAPLSKGWLQGLSQGAIFGASEESSVEVDRLQLIVLLQRVDLALADDGIGEDLVPMTSRKDFVLTDVLLIRLGN